jgi:thiol-disulfide isomerase/thioredoxin
MTRSGLAAFSAALLLLLVGCSGDDSPGLVPGPGPAKIDVDTPELRQAKQAAGIEDCVPGWGEPVDGGLPQVTLPCFGGGRDVDLSTLRGPLVVNVWGSFCGPCRTEMPVLQQFHEDYGDRVGVVGIDYQDPQTGAAMDLARKSGVTYPLLADPQSDIQGQEPFPLRMGLPILAFVAADGTTSVASGGVESVSELVGLVDEHLGIDL